MKGTDAPDGCYAGIHRWETVPRGTDTDFHPRRGDSCLCGAYRWLGAEKVLAVAGTAGETSGAGGTGA